MSRLTGTVRFYNFQRGFGFIQSSQQDYFVHVSDLDSDLLLEGEEVTFEAVESSKGFQALEVQRVRPPILIENEGEIIRFDLEKGYGFISRPQMADVFFHISDFEQKVEASELTPGRSVRFVVRSGRSGRDRAHKVNFA